MRTNNRCPYFGCGTHADLMSNTFERSLISVTHNHKGEQLSESKSAREFGYDAILGPIQELPQEPIQEPIIARCYHTYDEANVHRWVTLYSFIGNDELEQEAIVYAAQKITVNGVKVEWFCFEIGEDHSYFSSHENNFQKPLHFRGCWRHDLNLIVYWPLKQSPRQEDALAHLSLQADAVTLQTAAH